jgi:hypothetical protein
MWTEGKRRIVMGKINWGRVVLGGLLTGIVVNVFEGVAGTIFEAEYQAAMEALGKTMEMSTSTMVFYFAWGFIYGLVAVGLYAAVRPRFGAGPKTAVGVGITVWLVAYLMPSLAYAVSGLFPAGLVLIGTAIGLVESVIGTVVGAWVYKEE